MGRKISGRRLNRSSGYRRAMYRNLVTDLLGYGKITTTETKAKQVRSLVDKMITLGKEGGLHSRRQALAFIFKKKVQPKLDENEKIWFFDMQGDGSSLSKAKKFGPQYKNDIPKLLELWNKNRAIEKPYSWLTPVKEIVENDYILSANTYNPYSEEETITHREPKEILKEIKEKEREIIETLFNLKSGLP